jgi:hypothetical protein
MGWVGIGKSGKKLESPQNKAEDGNPDSLLGL